jgi:hypothetical protein
MSNEKERSGTVSLLNEELVDLSTARRTLIPRKRSGKTVAPSTVWRWINSGLDGVRLEVCYIGSVPHTSKPALCRFFDAVTAARFAKKLKCESTTAIVTDAELLRAGLI